jgi:uncharacterized protein (TIGR04141 family)
MARKPRLEKLTISLLKQGSTRQAVLREPSAYTSHTVAAIDPSRPSLFVLSRVPHAPRWAKYLEGQVSPALSGLVTASSSAVLLVEANGRLFAVTFGQGRYMVDDEALERDFGLRVVLNTVAPDQLKSVDAKTIDETTVHTRRDVSRESALSAFGLDVSRDLLRAVTGTPLDETLAHRLTGADSLGITTRVQLGGLRELASRLLEAHEAITYKQNFDFIDHLRPEKDPARIEELDGRLIEALATKEIDDVHLAAPQTLDWLELAGFRLSTVDGDEDPAADPRISVYLASVVGKEIDLPRLRRDRLCAMSSGDQVMAEWSIYRCIVYQVESGGALYVLTGGQWFRVDLAYKEQVYADVEALAKLEGLPDADAGSGEDAYNVKAATALGGLCLDRKLVYDGGPDKMEICDILTNARQMIHVKQRGSSSTLSHLFLQGLNSAERLLADEEFRKQARDVIEAENPTFVDLVPVARPDPANYEVGFVVITRSERSTPLTLPFFSVVSLRAATRALRGFGYGVSVAAVKEV